MMSTRNYPPRFALIGLVLLAGISGSPVLAATNVVSNSTSPTIVNNNYKPQAIPPQTHDGGARMNPLNLSDAQLAQIKQITDTMRQKLDAVLTPEQRQQRDTARQNHKRANLNLSSDQKAQIKATREQAKTQVDAVLTPEQRQLREQLLQQRQKYHHTQHTAYGNNHPTATVGKWKLDKSQAKFGQLTHDEQAKFFIFQNAIANEGMSPKDAAKKISNAKYELVNQKTHQYQICLGNRKLTTFFVDNANHKVTISQVGGQTNSPFAIPNSQLTPRLK